MPVMVLSDQCRFNLGDDSHALDFLTGEELVGLDIRISGIRRKSRGRTRKAK